MFVDTITGDLGQLIKVTWGGPASPLSVAVISAEPCFCQEVGALCQGALVGQAALDSGAAHSHAIAAAAGCDAAIVDLDPQPGPALEFIAAVCAQHPAITVIACSEREDSELLIRCMRAGARDLLRAPVSSALLDGALGRAAARRETGAGASSPGRVLLFTGSKGGAGVSTLAANFALALRQESGHEVVLADFSTPLGDAAMLLSVTPRFTIADALVNMERLDGELLSGIVVRHASGLALLPASERLNGSPLPGSDQVLARLARTLLGLFRYVVIDGSKAAHRVPGPLFDLADRAFLVTQTDVPGLRNAQKIVAYARKHAERPVEVVLNRFDMRDAEIGEQQIAKFLGTRPDWRLPNDTETVRGAQNSGRPFVTGKSWLSRAVCDMARAVCGKPAATGRRRLGLFGR